MARWQPVSELTPEIVTGTRRMLVKVTMDDVYLLEGGVTEDGRILELEDNDRWVIYSNNWMEEYWWVTWFMVIDAPPEG